MPIDLGKSLGSSGAVASATLPSKTSMNLLVRERKNRNAWKYALAMLVLACLVGIFAKFAVVDVFKQVDLKKTELHAAQQEYSAVQKQLEDYEKVLEEYRSYTGIASNGAADALRIMEMVGTVVQSRATVTSASTSEGTLVVNVKDISLDELGKLADILREEKLVENVSVTMASETLDSNDKRVSATLQVSLVGGIEEGE